MSNGSRTRYLKKNAVEGALSYAIQVAVTFISRVFFIRYLGIGYLGVNDLYTNILSVLALANLGVDTVLMYSLYKPIADNDITLIRQLMYTFKRLYRIIALAILLIGVMIIPFLQYIIKDSGLDNLTLIKYYLFFLINSVCSYLIVYKSALMQADQQVFIVKRVKMISSILCGILQIIVIAIFKNYIFYLLMIIITTLINNLILNFEANKKYPMFLTKEKYTINEKVRSDLINNTKSMFLYKIGTTVVNSTDNILISVIMGSVMVGYYSNYHTVIAAITSIIGIVNTALIPGIGNFLVINKGGENRTKLFESILLIYFVIATICVSALIICFDPLIAVWIGKQYILKRIDVIAIIICFYLQCIAHPMWMFRETSGLFREVKTSILVMALLNIIFSVILGKLIGISGIIFATSLSRILTLFWYEPKLLYNIIFKNSVLLYWRKWFKYFGISCFLIAVSLILYFVSLNSIVGITLKLIIILLVSAAVFYIAFHKTDEWIYLLSKIKIKKPKEYEDVTI